MSKVTVTGKTGPAAALTATVINGISGFAIDCDNEILTVFIGGAPQPAIDIAAATTITVTVSGNNYTVSIS